MNTHTTPRRYSKLLSSLTSLFIGIIFIYSAYTKLFPIELFELTFVDLGIASWTFAPILARLFIGIEFFLGVLLIVNLNPSGYTYKAVLVLLVAFTLYLIIQILLNGNKGNCGCFGDALPMTPAEGILKNILLIGAVALLYKFHKGYRLKYEKPIIITFCIAALSLPFVLNPVSFDASSNFDPNTKGYQLNMDLLYNSPDNPKPDKELRKGKWIVAYFSLTCKHCKIAAYKLQLIKKNNPEIPVYFILNGKEKNLQPFFNETKSEHIPHILFTGGDFIKMSGPELPAIFLLENNIVQGRPNYFTLNQSEIETWLQLR